jgi:S1-C subfamily serine protease
MGQFGRSAIGTILALTAGFVAPAAALAADRNADGAVVVLAQTATDTGFGAGTIVAMNGNDIRVLTADHVATHGALSVRFDNGAAFPAHIVAQIPNHDLAVIEATVDPLLASTLHPAPVAAPLSHEQVHIWGSGVNGPALETASIEAVGAELPDGPANGRYALGCDTCHQGDSGGGVFDARGDLVGVYVGYFEMDAGSRISVAQLPSADALSFARIGSPGTILAAADFTL